MKTTEQLLDAALAAMHRAEATRSHRRAARWARIADKYFVACYGAYR